MTVAVRFLCMGIFLVAALVWLGATMYVLDDAERWRRLNRHVEALDGRVDALDEWRLYRMTKE